jgi:hypothetical protein
LHASLSLSHSFVDIAFVLCYRYREPIEILISSCARASRHQHSKHINQGMINCSKTLNPVISLSLSVSLTHFAIILVTRTTYFSIPTHPTNLAFLPCTKDYDRFRLTLVTVPPFPYTLQSTNKTYPGISLFLLKWIQ